MGKKSKLKALRKEMGITREYKQRFRETVPVFFPDWMKYSLDPFACVLSPKGYFAGFDIGQVFTDEKRHDYQMAKKGI